MHLSLAELLATLPQVGQVQWLGLRPQRRATMLTPHTVELQVGSGIVGDRYQGRGQRDVTLIQAEHVIALASLLGRPPPLDPALLRRNIVVSGINLLALKSRHFRIGTAILATTGLCHPCSRMEDTLGTGGYNALRGHGGITARVVESGTISLHDPVSALSTATTPEE